MTIIYLIWAIILFFLPGVLLHRRWPSAFPPLTIYASSAGLWFFSWQMMNLGGIPFSRVNLSIVGLGLSGVVALASRGGLGATNPRCFSWWKKPHGIEWIWCVAALLGFASVCLRALLDPLSGWDNKFRWEGLALQWIRMGDLSGYPPLTPRDFEIYPWLDGLPPFVAGINAYLYVMIGSVAKQWTAIRVMGEVVLVGYSIGALSKVLWGNRAIWPALGIAGSSALLGWSIAIGQETGQLVIAFVGSAALWGMRDKSSSRGDVIGFGFLVAVGAAAREYGAILILLGLFHVVRDHRFSWPLCFQFLLPIAFVVGPWYGRNLWLTGNPIYPLSPGGLLPTVEFYTDLNESIAEVWGWGGEQMAPAFVVAALFMTAGGGVVLGIVALPELRRTGKGWLIVWFLAIVGLWAWSVPYTAGGFNYSLRVLSPALVLAAVFAGRFGIILKPTSHLVVSLIVLFVSFDGARRAWILPNRAVESPWTVPLFPWNTIEKGAFEAQWDPLTDQVSQLAGGTLVAVDNLDFWVKLRNHSARAISTRSPATLSMWNNDLEFDAVVNELANNEIHVVIVSLHHFVVFRDASKSKFLIDLVRNFEPRLIWNGSFVYDLAELRAHPEL